LKQNDKEKIRGEEIALIPQSVNYLDPLQQVGKQIGISIKDKENKDKVIEELFQKYDLEKEAAQVQIWNTVLDGLCLIKLLRLNHTCK